MSQKAGLGIHKIDGKAHFEYKGYKVVFGRDLNGKVHILDQRWQNQFGDNILSVEDAIQIIENYLKYQDNLDRY